MPSYLPREVERHFPALKRTQYKKTSEATCEYNCVAYAAGDMQRWWEAGNLEPHHYWPSEVPQDSEFSTLVEVFKLLGYTTCDNGKVEKGFEKVALYIHHANGTYTHAAKQLSNGKWSSKMGDCEDIRHDCLESLEYHLGHPAYGRVHAFMKRKKK